MNVLEVAFEKYFFKRAKEDYWIAFPFNENYFNSSVLSVREKYNPIELRQHFLKRNPSSPERERRISRAYPQSIQCSATIHVH